jgi:hypothetical protein
MDQDKIEQIIQERKILTTAASDHPFIVQLHYAFTTVRTLCLKSIFSDLTCTWFWIFAQEVNFSTTSQKYMESSQNQRQKFVSLRSFLHLSIFIVDM